MQLINQTHWRTDHLKAIIQRVAEDELSPSQRKTVVIHLTYGTRSTDSCGHTLSGRTGLVKHDGKWTPYQVRVCVSSQEIDRVDFASVVAHEFAHVRGLLHPDMQTPRYARIGNYRELYAWADAFPLEGGPTRPRVPWTVKGKKEHMEAVRQRWECEQRGEPQLARRYHRQARALQVRLVKATVRRRV